MATARSKPPMHGGENAPSASSPPLRRRATALSPPRIATSTVFQYVALICLGWTLHASLFLLPSRLEEETSSSVYLYDASAANGAVGEYGARSRHLSGGETGEGGRHGHHHRRTPDVTSVAGRLAEHRRTAHEYARRRREDAGDVGVDSSSGAWETEGVSDPARRMRGERRASRGKTRLDERRERTGAVPNVPGHTGQKSRTKPDRERSEELPDALQRPLSRGYSGLPMDQTTALIGASRGQIECDVDVSALAYWNDPQGDRDRNFVSPFRVEGTKYITFEPDTGGFNNVRMSLEIVVVFAAATGRTLVLPPDQGLYLLDKGKKGERRERGFADFLPLTTSVEFQKRVPVITMPEFLEREGRHDGGLVRLQDDERDKIMSIANACENRKKSNSFCGVVYDRLKAAGAHVPALGSNSILFDDCLIFDEGAFQSGVARVDDPEKIKVLERFCGDRTQKFYNQTLHAPSILHFQTKDRHYRLLNHFYSFVLFTNPVIDNHYKRFVRDFLHYNDAIFCAAGKIVLALQEDGRKLGFNTDDEGGGGYSALHIRRGDLQFKEVKISGAEWYENTKDVWLPHEILYIASDERNRTFFDPIAKQHDLRFLDDYVDAAGLADLDPNAWGMVDTVVASRGRAFAGTWFSTFSGYIIRMRGYHGMSKLSSYYGWKQRKRRMHRWEFPTKAYYPREWPIGWVGIDGDEIVTRDFESSVNVTLS